MRVFRCWELARKRFRAKALGGALTIGLNLLPSSLAWAADKPELSLLLPAGGQLGTSVDVVAQGKFPVWPLQTWTDSPHVQWSCQAESGKLHVDIGPEAELGLHWLRLYEPNGATALRPYLVGRAPEAIEVEPNDRPSEAQSIDHLPFTVQGVLNRRADVDLFAVQLSEKQFLSATVDSAKWLSSPADVNLQILDARGFVLSENLDHVGLDPYLEFTAPRDGKYLVRLFAFPAAPDSTIAFSGGSDWIYRLRLEGTSAPLSATLDFARQPELSAPTTQLAIGAHTSPQQALPVDLPVRLAGVIGEPKQVDYVRFAAQAGANYRFKVLARDCGSPLDATLAVLDVDAKQLTKIDDVGQQRDPTLDWKAPSDGQFMLSIGDFHQQGGERYAYFLQLEKRSPDFSAHVSSDLYSASVGQALEIEVNIVRELDYAGVVQVGIEGLPSSVECATVESIHGTDSAAKVTLKLTATAALQVPLRIVANAPQASIPAEAAADTAIAAEAQTTQSQSPPRQVETLDHKPLWLSATP